MNINTNEIREKLKYVKNGELQPTVEAIQALKDVVLAVPALLDEVDGLRERCRAAEGDIERGCETCLHENLNAREEPCYNCTRHDYTFPGWQWRGPQQEGAEQ